MIWLERNQTTLEDYQNHKRQGRMVKKPEIDYKELDFYQKMQEFDILYAQDWTPGYGIIARLINRGNGLHSACCYKDRQ